MKEIKGQRQSTEGYFEFHKCFYRIEITLGPHGNCPGGTGTLVCDPEQWEQIPKTGRVLYTCGSCGGNVFAPSEGFCT